ncbi:MAG TPA: biotin--[acetyl-CoA-carboxylase] ligase [Spirochaetia bacterium]|nr:biotin--[acetyl-CoA-carboxylase] ligase [Spirochaetia bacterium]
MNHEIRGRILALLREQTGTVSGEKMSRALGVSRVSIWKHIARMREAGYPIEAGPRGYRLDAGEPGLELDILSAWEFTPSEFKSLEIPGPGYKVHYFEEIDTTMEEARLLAEKGCPDGTLVIAGRQRRGRGRGQRVWISEEGGLYFTLVLRPDLPLMQAHRALFGASVALAETLRKHYGLEARIKWPNDVLVGGKKIAGMLADIQSRSDMIRYLNLGIGINVNNDPGDLFPESCSVSGLTGRRVPRKGLLLSFLRELDDWRRRPEDGSLIRAWKSLSATIGCPVRIVSPGGQVTGTAVDVDETGALIVEGPDGGRKRVFYGDCHDRIGPGP